MVTMKMRRFMKPRNILFLFFSLSIIILYYGPFRELLGLSLKSELYSHIVLIPLVSGYFFYDRRKSLLLEVNSSVLPGAVIAAFGIILYFIGTGQGSKLNSNDYLSLMVFSARSFAFVINQRIAKATLREGMTSVGT